MTDAGVTGSDTFVPPAGAVVCNSPTDCEDGNPCTTETCVNSGCVHTATDGSVCGADKKCHGPVCFGGPGAAQDIAVGADFVCAIGKGDVHCWGNHNKGQIGHGKPALSYYEPTPVKAGFTGNPVDIAAQQQHVCVVDRGASPATRVVWCWGENYWGSAGQLEPLQLVKPTQVPGVSDAVRVATGHGHSCAVTASGEVWCWGNNGDGQLGDGQKCGKKCPKPVKVAGISDALLVAAGGDRTCVTRAGGSVWCWGDNTDSYLGTGSFSYKILTAERVGKLVNTRALAVGELHACAVNIDNSVRCWGNGTKGEIGDGKSISQTEPTLVTGAVLPTVAAGRDHTCGRTGGDGKLLCWGDNDWGEIATKATDKVVTPTQPWAVTDVRMLDTGSQVTCYIDKAGKPWCVGSELYGQLGDGNKNKVDVPVAVSVSW